MKTSANSLGFDPSQLYLSLNDFVQVSGWICRRHPAPALVFDLCLILKVADRRIVGNRANSCDSISRPSLGIGDPTGLNAIESIS